MNKRELAPDNANIAGIIGAAAAVIIGKQHNIYEAFIGYIICSSIAYMVIRSVRD